MTLSSFCSHHLLATYARGGAVNREARIPPLLAIRPIRDRCSVRLPQVVGAKLVHASFSWHWNRRADLVFRRKLGRVTEA